MDERNNIDNSPIKIVALGGLGEVGKNTYCIENDSTQILIDAGVLFATPDLPGINYIIPDYSHVKDAGSRFKALFITHGHEDHIGGIPFLLNRVQIPVIYAPKLALGLIKHKLEEMKSKPNVKLVEYDSNSVIKINDFTFKFFHVTHSIPDSYAIKIETPHGNILHTGDFKVDLTPVDFDFDLSGLAKCGANGVDLLLADSTNAEKEGYTPSEKSVVNSLNEVFRQAEGRIIISTFSSNISRIQQILATAIKYERKIAILGRSMESNIQAAREYGFIKIPDNYFINNLEAIKKMNPSEVLILCTGSQGESLAALSRIAFNQHRVKINFGDTVIFSSSPIPGNTTAINKVINQLTREGANVLTNSSSNKLHASGHPCKQELRLMQKLIKPKYFMPIHGEYHMLKLHADIAKECGLPSENTFVCANGDSVILENHKCRYGERIFTDVEYCDTTESFGISTNVIKDRSLLSTNGLVSLLLIFHNDSLLENKITIDTKGFSYYINSDSSYVKDLKSLLAKEIVNKFSQNTNIEVLKDFATNYVARYFYKITHRNPVVVTQTITY